MEIGTEILMYMIIKITIFFGHIGRLDFQKLDFKNTKIYQKKNHNFRHYTVVY